MPLLHYNSVCFSARQAAIGLSTAGSPFSPVLHPVGSEKDLPQRNREAVTVLVPSPAPQDARCKSSAAVTLAVPIEEETKAPHHFRSTLSGEKSNLDHTTEKDEDAVAADGGPGESTWTVRTAEAKMGSPRHRAPLLHSCAPNTILSHVLKHGFSAVVILVKLEPVLMAAPHTPASWCHGRPHLHSSYYSICAFYKPKRMPSRTIPWVTSLASSTCLPHKTKRSPLVLPGSSRTFYRLGQKRERHASASTCEAVSRKRGRVE